MASYGQKNYLQAQGIPPTKYRIDQIGCFLTAFCNLLEAYGKGIDPLSLNNQFVARGIYIDVDDGVRDDLGWSSVSQYNPNIVVTRSVDKGINPTAGWPNTNSAIVRFRYKSVQTGQMIYHFCKVQDFQNHIILDSYDGVVKRSPYGEPTGFAEYADRTPVPVQPPAAPSTAGKKLFLPSAAGLWRVYPLTKQPIVGNEVGKLAPGKFPPGLYYDVLGNPMTHVYTIQTESFGRVNVYAGPDTIAQFVDAPAPPAPAPTPPPAPVIPQVSPTPTPVVETPTPPAPADDNSVPVKVISWKETFTPEVKEYTAKQDATIKDLDNLLPDTPLHNGNSVHAAGTFKKDGIEYVRSVKSTQDNVWYGLPVDVLEEVKPGETDADFDLDAAKEFKALAHNLSSRERLVGIVATLKGFLLKLGRTITFKNKK